MQEVLQILGSGLITASWAMLLTRVLQNKIELNRQFVGLYLIGEVVLTIGGASRGLDFIAILNMSSVILAVIIFLKLK